LHAGGPVDDVAHRELGGEVVDAEAAARLRERLEQAGLGLDPAHEATAKAVERMYVQPVGRRWAMVSRKP